MALLGDDGLSVVQPQGATIAHGAVEARGQGDCNGAQDSPEGKRVLRIGLVIALRQEVPALLSYRGREPASICCIGKVTVGLVACRRPAPGAGRSRPALQHIQAGRAAGAGRLWQRGSRNGRGRLAGGRRGDLAAGSGSLWPAHGVRRPRGSHDKGGSVFMWARLR
jgi:hypothetical protein